MTSNLGTEFVLRGGTLGFAQHRTDNNEERESHDKISKALKSTFRPEFLNRIDDIIIFSPLSQEQMVNIVDLQMVEVCERLGEHGIFVNLTEAARQWLAKEGYDAAFGARPLRRALQKFVESPLSIRILRGDFIEGDKILVDVDENEIVFKKEPSTTKLKKASRKQAEVPEEENSEEMQETDTND